MAEFAADGILPEHGLSQVERVVDTFVAPSKTFADILRNASWWLPFLLMLLSTVGSAVTVGKKVGFDRVYANQIHQSPKQEERMAAMEPAQRAQAMKLGMGFSKGAAYGFPVLLLITQAIYAVLLWAAFNFGLGAKTTYPQVLAVTWYAALPFLVTAIITILTLSFGGDADAYSMQNPVGTNPGYYMTEAAPMVRALLSSLDIVRLWSVVLTAIGMAIISRKSLAQSALIVGIFWVLGVLVGVAGAAFS